MKPILVALALLFSSSVALADEKAKTILTGLWNGSYSYAGDGTGRPDVAFSAVMLQQGDEITGFIREANTFGATDDPWLHALLKGKVDPETGSVTFTKTYDGTSGVDHDVEYAGKLDAKGQRIEAGKWQIGEFSGTFKIAKDPKVRTGKVAGHWRGENVPLADSDIPTVKVSMVLLHKGDEIIGFAREPRVGQDGTNPWFHATVKGDYDADTGVIKLVKSYDGTARASAEEEYLGKFTDDGALTGKRSAKGTNIGKFNLKRDEGK